MNDAKAKFLVNKKTHYELPRDGRLKEREKMLFFIVSA